VTARERANQKAGALVNRWIEPVYCDSETDGGFALRIPTGDEGRKYVQRLQELIADEILAAKREAEGRMKGRCAGIEFKVERADTSDYELGWDNAESAFRNAIWALSSEYEEAL